MSKIKPFWRIMIGLAIFFNFVYSSSAMNIGQGSFFAFAFWGAALAAYIFLCVKIKYDDPLRSMRDLMAQQAQQKAEEKPAPDPAAEDRIAALEKELSSLREQLRDREGK